MIQTISLALLFILPFIVNPFAGAYYEFPKVIVAEIVIELIFVYCLLRSKLDRKNPYFPLLLSLFALSLIGLVFFPGATVFFGNPFRLQGTFLLWHLLIWAFVVSQFEYKLPQLEKPRKLETLLHLHSRFEKAGFWRSGYKLPKFLSPLPLLALFLSTVLIQTQSNNRAVATLGEPNALAATAIFFWPFAWFGAGRYSRLVKSLSFLAVLIIVYLSGSRSGFIALAVQVLFLLSLNFLKNWKYTVLLCLLVLMVSFILPGLDRSTGYKYEDRVEVWRVAAFAGLKSPLIGQGFGNVEEYIRKSAQNLNSDIQYQYVDSSHNIFLDFWIEGGIIGLGLFLALIYFSLKNFIDQKKAREVVLLLGLIAALSFNPASAATLVAFWWVLGRGLRSSN